MAAEKIGLKTKGAQPLLDCLSHSRAYGKGQRHCFMKESPPRAPTPRIDGKELVNWPGSVRTVKDYVTPSLSIRRIPFKATATVPI